ncbi:hypothetical protein CSOJ01_12697 [Colletotrichum sojae]|uniref:Uncharacterized protein n=1 Tax=Colletotrichum sojae TaxID=2175907 RepID=A0A8H6MM29_9PEZI|nr:hypothetical protein CSOJ01_12697 [Colletotrichum sojae]
MVERSVVCLRELQFQSLSTWEHCHSQYVRTATSLGPGISNDKTALQRIGDEATSGVAPPAGDASGEEAGSTLVMLIGG